MNEKKNVQGTINFKEDITELYLMTCACSCYSGHSDWLMLRPVMLAG